MAAQNAAPGDDDAFGPVGTTPAERETKFRVTSLHKALPSKEVTAYAVCGGRVRVQKDEKNAGLLTIVLAPDVEVLRGVPIRYFVYRGIREDSLIDSTGLKQGTALPDKLLAENSLDKNPDRLGLAFRRKPVTPPDPAAEFVREDSDAIDTLFFENTDLKAIPVQAGDNLGIFEGTGFGFEIMVRSIWPAPTLDQLRNVPLTSSSGNVIDVSSESDANRVRALRERVYEYLDPCAFYGMCFDRGVQYSAASAPAATISTPQEIYDLLLSKFANRNTVYIDIRNDNGLSYNYYDTYGSGDILLGMKTTILGKKKPKADPAPEGPAEPYSTHQWPLKIIDGSRFNVPKDAMNAGLRLAMDTGVSSGSIQRRVFLEFARLYYDSNAKRSPVPVDPGHSGRLAVVTGGTFTREVVLGLPTVVTDSTTQNPSTRPLAFAVRLRYLRQNESQPTTPARYVSTANQWDNLFTLELQPSRWKNDHSSSWWLTGHLKYVEPQIDNQQVYKGMAEAGMAVDRDPTDVGAVRYTFYCVPAFIVPEPTGYRVTSGVNPAGSGGNGKRTSFFQRMESATLYDGSCYLTLLKQSEFNSWSSAPVGRDIAEPLPDPADFLTYLTFLEAVRPDDQKEKGANPFHTKESVYAISFSAAEYEALLNHGANFDRILHPVFLQVRRRVFPRNDDTATHRAYQAIELRLAGYDSSGKYQSIDIPATGPNKILPLSLPADGMIFCTNDAAVFEPLEITKDVQICTQVRHESMQTLGLTSTQTVLRDAAHEHDVLYFTRAIADLKRYAPEFYKELQDMQLLGTPVILHDDPETPKRRRYRIRVTFDDSMRTDPHHPQVIVETHATALSEQQIQAQITEPIVNALSNPKMPDVEFIIGESMYRFSQVTITFAATSNAANNETNVISRITPLGLVPEPKTRISEGADPTGETSGRRFVGAFPGEQIPRDSLSDFKLTKLQTLGAWPAADLSTLIAADPLGYGDVASLPIARRLNESRYVALNTNRHLSSSEVNTLFLADYTAAEIDADSFRPDRIYIETQRRALRKKNETPGPFDSPPYRITLEDLKLLGLGTYDPEKPINIRLNRRAINSRDENHLVSGKDSGHHPRRRVVSRTLAHELGHAEFMIRHPLIDAIWSTLESIFDYQLAKNGPPVITKLIGSGTPTDICSYQLLKTVNYPTPLLTKVPPEVISTSFATEDAKRTDVEPGDNPGDPPKKPNTNAKLLARFFLTKTGGGHLRGSPTGARACAIEQKVDAEIVAEAISVLQSVSFDYCFLNLDEVDLNPNDS